MTAIRSGESVALMQPGSSCRDPSPRQGAAGCVVPPMAADVAERGMQVAQATDPARPGCAMIRIGTAGWSVPRPHAAAFPRDGSHLVRYAQRFTAAEINSSFYRLHRPQTYARWAAAVPQGFRFAVKMPREITHLRRLVDVAAPLDRFLGDIGALSEALGPVLVQMPPSLAWSAASAGAFLAALRGRFDGAVVCEPRHPTWFCDAAGALLGEFRVARVAADPAPVPRAAVPGGWPGLAYWRLHGAPEIYRSAYDVTALDAIAGRLRDAAAEGREAWCIFDNTASGAATDDGLLLLARLGCA